MSTVKYPHIKVKMVGEDGNAFAIIGRVSQALRRAGVPQDEIEQYQQESTSETYDNLLVTALKWVTCDAPDVTSESNAMFEYWMDVEFHAQDAHLIAWDTCHKIYLAMDEYEANWFRENYDTVVEGPAPFLMATLKEWYKNSCGLKFIQAVWHNAEDPNEGFVSLIPQGAEDEGRCSECGDYSVYTDGMCESCWDMGSEDDEDEDEDY